MVAMTTWRVCYSTTAPGIMTFTGKSVVYRGSSSDIVPYGPQMLQILPLSALAKHVFGAGDKRVFGDTSRHI